METLRFRVSMRPAKVLIDRGWQHFGSKGFVLEVSIIWGLELHFFSWHWIKYCQPGKKAGWLLFPVEYYACSLLFPSFTDPRFWLKLVNKSIRFFFWEESIRSSITGSFSLRLLKGLHCHCISVTMGGRAVRHQVTDWGHPGEQS